MWTYQSPRTSTNTGLCLGSPAVRASDLQLNGREFDARLPHYRSVVTGMSDCLRASKQPQCATSHTGQLSLRPPAGREMSTGQNAVMLCGWGVNAGWLIPLVDKCMGGR